MDYFAHGAWSYLTFCKRKHAWWAVFFGVLPDTLSWVPYFFYRLFTGDLAVSRPHLDAIPHWVQILYGFSHSIIICAAVFLAVYVVKRKVFYFMLPWPLLHILIDIPTHRSDFLPTPFLWPVSDYAFPGISWANPWFMGINYILIISFFVYRKLQKKSDRKNNILSK